MSFHLKRSKLIYVKFLQLSIWLYIEGIVFRSLLTLQPIPISLGIVDKTSTVKIKVLYETCLALSTASNSTKVQFKRVSRFEFCRIHWIRRRIIFYLYIIHFITCVFLSVQVIDKHFTCNTKENCSHLCIHLSSYV